MPLSSATTDPPFLVLAAVDSSSTTELVTSQAATLALAKENAKLHLIHVVDHIPTMAGLGSSMLLVPSTARLVQQAWDCLDRLLSVAEQKGIVAVGHVAVGPPLEKVLELATELGADVLVVGTHDPGKLAHLLFGSVAQELVRQAPCPVFVVRPKHPARPAEPGPPSP